MKPNTSFKISLEGFPAGPIGPLYGAAQVAHTLDLYYETVGFVFLRSDTQHRVGMLLLS